MTITQRKAELRAAATVTNPTPSNPSTAPSFISRFQWKRRNINLDHNPASHPIQFYSSPVKCQTLEVFSSYSESATKALKAVKNVFLKYVPQLSAELIHSYCMSLFSGHLSLVSNPIVLISWISCMTT